MFELVVTVFFDEPAVAVIVTEVAFVACQFSVTLWPAVIEVGFADKITVGTDGPEPEDEVPWQAISHDNANGMVPQRIHRKVL